MSSGETTSWDQCLGGIPGGMEWVPFIHATGFGDFNWVVTLDSSHWEQMLDGVSHECERITGPGNVMKMGHRMYITSRLGQEKLRRGAIDKEARERQAAVVAAQAGSTFVNNGTANMSMQGPLGSPRRIQAGGPAVHDTLGDTSGTAQPSTTAVVLVDGIKMTCSGSKTWICCAGLAIIALIVALFLLALRSGLSSSSKTSSTSAAAGGWSFVQVLMVIGFIISGAACMIGSCLYCRDPNSRDACNGIDMCQSCQNCSICDGGCGGCKLPSCSSPDVSSTCPSCPSCSGPSDCACAPSRQCMEDALPGCTLPQCNAGTCHCCDDCKCPSCSCNSLCAGCCDDCTMPKLNCECCPSCDGCSGCFATCTKILCCRCKIQIA